MYRSKTLNIP